MGFLDPFGGDGGGDGVSRVSGGLSRPSAHRRHSSRSGRSHTTKRRRSRSSSRGRAHSRTRSAFGDAEEGNYQKHTASRGSFFGMGNNSKSSFFGQSRPSYYKRSPRQGFFHKAYKQLKRILRDLKHYAKRHPWKVFFLVIMPLITGGALTALLARFGLRMPRSLERMLGLASKAATGDSFGLMGDAVRMAGDMGNNSSVRVERGRDGGYQWERTSAYGSSNYYDKSAKRGRDRDEGWGSGLMSMAKKLL